MAPITGMKPLKMYEMEPLHTRVSRFVLASIASVGKGRI